MPIRRMAIVKKINVGKNMEKLEPLHTVGGSTDTGNQRGRSSKG